MEGDLENFSDLDNLLSLAEAEEFFSNSKEPEKTKRAAIVIEENDCELVSINYGANKICSSISSFFFGAIKSRDQKISSKPKDQKTISSFFKPPKRLPDEPVEQLEPKKMSKIVKKPKGIETVSSEIVKKRIPKFKLIPGTPFSVDAFSYGQIDQITGYFLTHFHSDHYKGLSNKIFADRPGNRLYCSEVTANLVKKELKMREEFITILKVGLIYIIEGIHVGVFDANQ